MHNYAAASNDSLRRSCNEIARSIALTTDNNLLHEDYAAENPFTSAGTSAATGAGAVAATAGSVAAPAATSPSTDTPASDLPAGKPEAGVDTAILDTTAENLDSEPSANGAGPDLPSSTPEGAQ